MNEIQLSGKKESQIRIRQMTHKLLDAADRVLHTLIRPPAPAPSVTVARRQVANMLRVSQFCSNTRCRRSGACRGEPADCLRTILPLMPDAMAGLLKIRRRRC